LDCNKVEIGDRVLFGPNVSLYPATHPTQPEERAKGAELAFPIKVLTIYCINGISFLK
jgi:acetyltransferase-like isoleucine patch superfamily enzyme